MKPQPERMPEPESEPEPQPEPQPENEVRNHETRQVARLDRTSASIRAAVLGEVAMLPDEAMRELHRLLQNAQNFEVVSTAGTRADYLRSLGCKDDAVFEVLPHALDHAKTFDILMFRGTDFVSDAIARASMKHRGADFFSHVGMVIKPPLIPRHGRYLRSGAVDDTGEFGNLPFVHLKMKIVQQAQQRVLRVTVVECVRLPERLDEGSLKEDPYVRLILEPWGDASKSQNGEKPGTAFVDEGIKKGNPVQTPFILQSGPSPKYNFEADIPFPETCKIPGGHGAKPKLRIEVWDRDWYSPDDLMAEASLAMDSPIFLEPMYTEEGYDGWIRLEIADYRSADSGLRAFVALPECGTVSGSDPETTPVPEAAVHESSETEFVKGHLLMAPLGRKYKKLYDTENFHMGCRTHTYKMLFTWRYFSLLWALVVWSLINFFFFLRLFHQGYGSVRWRFNSSAALTEADVVECDEQDLNIDECELHNWWFTAYMQVADWIITACFCVDVVLRLYCLRRHWLDVKWNRIDLIVTVFDIVSTILQYRRQASVGFVQVMRAMRFVRVASMVAMFYRIRRYKQYKWILHEVTVTNVGDDVQVSLDVEGHLADDDDKTAMGPYIIDHRVDPFGSAGNSSPVPASEASPARVLDRGVHIKYLRHQSDNCLLVPVIDISKNVIYLQFDALEADIRDMWIDRINALYRKRARKDLSDTVETVDHQAWQALNVPRQVSTSGRKIEFASSTAELGRMHSTSQGVVAEFKLQEYDPETRKPIPYIWEASASGTIAGFYNTSSVLDEESHKGALGVQIRPLREVLADYDGEVCMLRLTANWKGEAIDWDDPHVAEYLQQQITRVHELYYRRSYACNCFLCLATLFPKCAPCAKWMSRCCGFCCCGTFSAFREDSVKCSQLVANIYQAVGLMDPRANPSLVMPVDFLPRELLHHEHVEEGTESAALTIGVHSGALTVDADTPNEAATPQRSNVAAHLHTTHMGMKFLKEERGIMSSSRDFHALHDESHPHHERHKEIAEEGYGTSDSADSREASVKAFFAAFPKFDADVIPLKVRKVGANFAQENAEAAKRRWTAQMQQGESEVERLTQVAEELDETNHHMILELLGPLLEQIACSRAVERHHGTSTGDAAHGRDASQDAEQQGRANRSENSKAAQSPPSDHYYRP